MSDGNTKAVRTTAQALGQQKADAERDRRKFLQAADPFTGRAIEREPQQAIVPAPARAVPADGRTSVQTYIDDIAPSSIAGRMIKFGKDGKFIFAATDEVVSPDVDFVAMCDETLCGWIKFNRDAAEGTPPDRVMGLLYDNFVMPPRETLGDLNPADWPLGLSGVAEDCWQHQIALVLQMPGTHELFTYVTTSKTGRRAIGNLLRHYDRMRVKDPDHYPVVRLKASGFNHRDPRIGFVPVPLLAVVGKAPKTSAAIPDSSVAADLNDEIPFN
jgi:hypothetical protein